MSDEKVKSTFKYAPIELPNAKGLVLTRKVCEGIRVSVGGSHVDVTIVQIKGKQVRLAISTPDKNCPIERTFVKSTTQNPTD